MMRCYYYGRAVEKCGRHAALGWYVVEDVKDGGWSIEEFVSVPCGNRTPRLFAVH